MADDIGSHPPAVPGGLVPPEDARTNPDALIQRLLRAVREHLDLDVGFIGEIAAGKRVFRYVDAKPGVDVVAAGQSESLEETYCFHVLEGRLPAYLADPMEHPLAARLPATTRLPVGSHVSVPIRFSDGHVYGTFCCFALGAERTVAPEDVRAVQMMAELAAEYLEAMDSAQRERRQRQELIQAVIDDPEGLTVAFQPLRDLDTMAIIGLEALARFPGREQDTSWFFMEAADVGLGVDLEMRAVRMALDALPAIPEPIRLNVNVSPETLYTDTFFDAVADVPRDRLTVEVTEHAAIVDYADLRRASARLTPLGIRLAIDDVGMGFSGLYRILESSPQELKLDAAVARDVHTSIVKQALIETFCSFGARTGFSIVAEGIESADQLDVLRALGVKVGQGYHLGRPGPLRGVLPEGVSQGDP